MAGKSIVFQLGFAKVLAQTDQAQDSNSAACTCVGQVGQEGLKTILAGRSLNRAHLQAACGYALLDMVYLCCGLRVGWGSTVQCFPIKRNTCINFTLKGPGTITAISLKKNLYVAVVPCKDLNKLRTTTSTVSTPLGRLRICLKIGYSLVTWRWQMDCCCDARHCKTLQDIARHCKTLQDIARHCKTLPETLDLQTLPGRSGSGAFELCESTKFIYSICTLVRQIEKVLPSW